jgi:hypothetical protein
LIIGEEKLLCQCLLLCVYVCDSPVFTLP